MRLIISIFALLVISQNVQAKGLCDVYLQTSTETEMGITDKLIAYFIKLYDDGVINFSQLQDFKIHLETENRMINPVGYRNGKNETNFTDIQTRIHYFNVQDYVLHYENDIDKDKLRDQITRIYEEKQRIHQEKSKTKNQTLYPLEPIVFHPLPPGKWKREIVDDHNGNIITPVDVGLTHDFEMMATPITQWMWVDKMGYNPAEFADGPNSSTVLINGKRVKMQPNNPIENINWLSALVFANRYSEAHQLPPVYDLSEVVTKEGTSAEKGNLTIESGQVRINAPGGDIYLAKGFRLPTEAEIEWLMTMVTYDSAKATEYSWIKENSNNQTHPVAQLKPLIANGNDFFDIFGNVWEWTGDLCYLYDHLVGGMNPMGNVNTGMSGSRGIRGGSYKGPAFSVRSRNHGLISRTNSMGFRLVRTLK